MSQDARLNPATPLATLSSLERHELVFQHTADYAVVVLDLSGTIVDWNPGAVRVLGWTADEALGQYADLFFTEQDKLESRAQVEIQTAAREGMAIDERWHCKRDGSLFWALGELVALRRDGAVLGFVKILRDRTDERVIAERLRLLQASLAVSHEQLQLEVAQRTLERDRLWRLTHDLMTVSNVDGLILNANDACTHALGWASDELVGANILSLIHAQDVPAASAEMARLRQGLDTTQIELRMTHRDGSHRLISWSAVSASEQVYAVGRDITELRHTEDQLRQSQKMEAVGQLTGGIAHDFNNLLTGIIGSLDLMQRRYQSGRTDKLERYMSAATTSAQRAAALTQRLLAFSRRQTMDLQPTDINQLIASLEDLLRRTLAENISLDTRLGSGLGQALTDANQLESALLNLVINARDAMPFGGVMSLETSAVAVSETDRRTAGELAPGHYLRICVVDSGIGMTAEVRARAFEPFFTTKPTGQGTGLGLSMIYGYAKQSRGHVEISSQVGKGSRVCLYLPRYDGLPEAPLVGVHSEPRAGSGEVVLVVEDEPVVRSLVVEVLLELGYVVLQAQDAHEAIPVLQGGGRIDLLVSDVGLPGLDGRQLALIARQHRPHLPVLFATGHAQGTGAHDDLLPGMQVINKPFTIDMLAQRIREILP